MYDGDYEKLRKTVDGYAGDLAVVNYNVFNGLSDAELSLSEQLQEMVNICHAATYTLSMTVCEISKFLDKKYTSPKRPKSTLPITKEVLKPWTMKFMAER